MIEEHYSKYYYYSLHIDRKKNLAFILDPAIWFETDESQSVAVDMKKRNSYEPIGLFIGAWGTITKFFVDFAKNINPCKKIVTFWSTWST